MNKEPIIFITKPEKQLIKKDNLEIEINNYDNSHLYYKGFDLGTFKEIVNLRQENQELKKQVEERNIEYFKGAYDTHDKYYTQQKEFIKYLEDYLKLFDNKDIYEEGSYDTIEEILSKYKEIIGDDK